MPSHGIDAMLSGGLRFRRSRLAVMSGFLLGTAGLANGAALDADALRAAADYSAGHKGTALVVIRSGRIAFSEYPKGARSQPMKIYSGTKGFWNFAALAAQEDGILELDEAVGKT